MSAMVNSNLIFELKTVNCLYCFAQYIVDPGGLYLFLNFFPCNSPPQHLALYFTFQVFDKIFNCSHGFLGVI